jgi:hypothetical protein
MPEDEFHPLGVCSLLSPQAADVEATLLGRGAGLLVGPLAAHHDDAPGIREVQRHAIGLEGVEASGLQSALPGLVQLKKGLWMAGFPGWNSTVDRTE